MIRSRNNQNGRSKPASIEAEGFGDSGDDKILQSSTGLGAALLWAPFDRKGSYAGIVITSFFMEFLGTFVFAFFTNMAIAGLGGATDEILKGFLVGIVAAGTYYMAAGGWKNREADADINELPRHLSMTVTFANMFVLRTGFLILLGYWTMQIGGSLFAGLLLHQWHPAGVLPAPLTSASDLVSRIWGAELLGSGVIIFSILYNQYFGGNNTDEQKNRLVGVTTASLARFGLTVIFFQHGSYSFDGVIYLAGLIGSCSISGGCTDALPFNNAPVFYLLVPLLGVLMAVVVYYFLLAVGYSSKAKANFEQRPTVRATASRIANQVQSKIAELNLPGKNK